MAISKMKKASVICLKKDKPEVMKQLQAFGNLEFINLQAISKNEEMYNFLKEESNDNLRKEVEGRLFKLRNAISALEYYEEKESLIQSLRKPDQYMSYDEFEKAVYDSCWEDKLLEINSVLKNISNLEESISRLETRYEELLPWKELDVSINDINSIKKVHVFLGKFPLKYDEQCTAALKQYEDKVSLTVVSKSLGYINFLCILEKSLSDEVRKVLKEFEYEEVSLKIDGKPSESLDVIKNEIKEKKTSLSLEKTNFLLMSSYLKDLRICEEFYRNELIKIESSINLLHSKGTCVLSGWVPEDEEDAFVSYINNATGDLVKVVMSDVEEEEIDDVPIKLKNNGIIKPFESITEMYSLPKYNDLDPTPILSIFYAIFFGMMVGDLGYGILMILATMGALKFFNLNEGNRQFAKFFMYLGVTTSIWGLIFGGCFGDFIKLPALISQSEDIFTIMYMSVGFGVIQILVGLIMKAIIMIRAKDYIGAICDVGIWICMFLFIAMFAITGSKVWMYLMIASMVAIVLTNGRDAKSVGGKLGGGAYALYGLANYVGDLVSYTRLMALGIAGGSIATALNLIIGYLPSPAIFIAGPIIFVAAHIFNMLLGMLGAYVHGCRLQYVEYFGKFYEGGGRAFSPFKAVNEKIKINNSEEK